MQILQSEPIGYPPRRHCAPIMNRRFTHSAADASANSAESKLQGCPAPTPSGLAIVSCSI